MCALEENVTH